MIPILYDSNESAFTSNGLCRLRNIISCTVTEERNNIYECEFQYPVSGANYDLIKCGRIIAVTHDDTDDIQPFDIVSFSRPIDGVVTFRAVHISYRQSKMTASGTNVNSLSDAFHMLKSAKPSNPFNYWTNKTSTGLFAAADGVPRSVRQMLGGSEGSILDCYGGEYEWDKWTVKLWGSRGQKLDLTIRYGLNLMSYDEDVDFSETFTACIPYWVGGDDNAVVKGNKVSTGVVSYDGRESVVPLNLTDKFEEKPTAQQLENLAAQLMDSNRVFAGNQSIKVEFARLQDSPEYASYAELMKCSLCDSINVVFPAYDTSAYFKIVKTVYDVLEERFTEMELGALSTTLSQALGLGNNNVSVSDMKIVQSAADAQNSANMANGILAGMEAAAQQAGTTLNGIYATAEEASDTLADMKEAAEEAHTTLTGIYQDAVDAKASAAAASTAAESAQASATQALTDAASAQTAANSAQDSADQALTAAGNAQQSADNAQRDATTANKAANGALDQLSVVEDVVGVLNWISEHGTYAKTSDTEVVPGKYYFTRGGSSPNYTYSVVVSPSGNPHNKGYYELTGTEEAVANYVSSHLALTNEGLWVINDNTSYKILLSSTGMVVYDPLGRAVATYGESITFDSTREQTIGGTNAYIKWKDANNDGTADTLEIVADSVSFSSGESAVSSTQMDSAIGTAVDGIEVGGRNLILNTATQRATPASTDSSVYVSPTPTMSDYASSIMNNTTDEWTYSFDYTVTGNSSTTARVYVQIRARLASGSTVTIGTTQSGHYSKSFKLSSEQASTPTSKACGIRFQNATDGAVLTVTNIKLEKGNKATDWTPAPEDVQAEIDAKKNVHTLMTGGSGTTYARILGYAKEGTSTNFSIDITSTPITNVKIGDSVRLAYYVTDMGEAGNRPFVYINGTVTAIPDATHVTLTAHGLDTTIIDGGNIITNSIGASKIKVSEIEIGAAQITDQLEASQIKVEDIEIGAAQIGSGTIDTARIPNLDASKITAGKISDSSGKNYWNLGTGQFATQRGTVGLFTATDTELTYKANNTQIVFRENALSLRQRDYFINDPSTYYMVGLLINGGNINYYLTNDGDYDTTPIKMKISLHKHDSADNYGVVIKNASNSYVAAFFEGGVYSYPIGLWESTKVNANFSVTGTKSRQVETDNYSSRLLYCYETPTPLFGDIGEAVIEEDGYCYVDIDDIFGEAIANNAEYQVFLQKEGDGDCWIGEKTSRYFAIQGTPNLKVAWELKAKQVGYQNIRLEQPDYGLDEYIYQDEAVIEDYISEQEALLYGNY